MTIGHAGKAVAQTTNGFFINLISEKHRSGAPSLFALDGIGKILPGGCGFKNFSPFFETFNDVIGQQIASGLMNEFERLVSPPTVTRIDGIGPQVLTLEHLDLGFIACLIPLVAAIVVFCMELVVHGLKGHETTFRQSKNLNSATRKKSRRDCSQTQPTSLMKLDEMDCWTNYLHQSVRADTDRPKPY